MRQSHQKILFFAALALVLTVSFVSFLSIQRLVGHADRLEHSQGVLLDVGRMFSHLKDVESGARGFALTDDPRHLQTYSAGRTGFGESVRRLAAARQYTDGPESRLDRLVVLGRQRIEQAGGLVRLRREAGPPAELEALVARGTRTMEQLGREVDATVAAERDHFHRRNDALERQSWLTALAASIGTLLSIVALVWLWVIGRRAVVRRREAEAELRRLNADLEERVGARTMEVERSRALLDAVIENMPDTVFLKDAGDEFRYVLVNEAAERLLGLDREEMLGHVDHELFPRSEAALCRKEDEAVAGSGKPKQVAERSVTTDRGVRIVESRKVPLLLDGDERRYVLGIVRDLTDQRSLERQLREMQRMEAVGRLTGGVAHDFNNLLAIIMGSVEMVRERVASDSETAVIADEALDAVGRGADLVHRLLAFARKQHLEPEKIDLNARLPSVVPLLRRTLGEDIRIEVRPGDGLWPALIDPHQFDDALVNLAINARDAMPRGGALGIETANVELDEDYAAQHVEVVPGDYVMLAVSDTGTGMAPETLQRVFEPFFTTKEEGKGTGLGLSQIYGWVKQSGGHIKIYSELDHGTTIKLYLPRAVGPGAAAIAPEEGAAGVGGSERILVVEDNANVRRTVMRQLADLGYAPTEAADGRAALDFVRGGLEVDLLLTDVVMPGGMTGYELAAEVAKVRPELKVLFTSGYTELGETSRDVPLPGPLISKPYRKRELGRAIRSLLDG